MNKLSELQKKYAVSKNEYKEMTFDDLDLLNNLGKEEYRKVEQTALEEYRNNLGPAWEKYAEIEKQAFKEYKKIEKSAKEKYQQIRELAAKEYRKVEQTALEEYEQIHSSIFKKLLENKKYRAEIE